MRNKENKHIGLKVEADIHYKLHYIANYHGCSANAMVLRLIHQCFKEFERQYGEIEEGRNES